MQKNKRYNDASAHTLRFYYTVALPVLLLSLYVFHFSLPWLIFVCSMVILYIKIRHFHNGKVSLICTTSLIIITILWLLFGINFYSYYTIEPVLYGVAFIVGIYLYYFCDKDIILSCIVIISFAYILSIRQEFRGLGIVLGGLYSAIIILFKKYRSMTRTGENAYVFFKKNTLEPLMYLNVFSGVGLFMKIITIEYNNYKNLPFTSLIPMWTIFLWIVIVTNMFSMCLNLSNIKEIYLNNETNYESTQSGKNETA